MTIHAGTTLIIRRKRKKNEIANRENKRKTFSVFASRSVSEMLNLHSELKVVIKTPVLNFIKPSLSVSSKVWCNAALVNVDSKHNSWSLWRIYLQCRYNFQYFVHWHFKNASSLTGVLGSAKRFYNKLPFVQKRIRANLTLTEIKRKACPSNYRLWYRVRRKYFCRLRAFKAKI